MSELKEHKFCECDEIVREYRGQLSNEMRTYYLKSEADKVIAEKDEKIDELEERIDELQKATDSAWSKVNAMYDELRHNKRKRCLDKAAMCKARYDAEDAKVNGCGASWEYISEEMKYWERWSWYWEALADEPTWAKFLQLIHKEADK